MRHLSDINVVWFSFAFRFLVESHRRFRQSQNQQYKSVLDRIQKACRGHLKWLHLVQQQTSGQRFGANYWVTGKQMNKPELSESWIAEESLLDTGFQILKAATCTELWEDKDIADELAAELMSDWSLVWLLSMEKSDKRKKYAWPHAEKEDVNTFRLDDHVWIWRAVKSLEMNDGRAWDKLPDKARKCQLAAPADKQEVSDGTPVDWDGEIERLHGIFKSESVQREVSKRFTTENTFLQKRMLAVTRSIRETRFRLHARETALLYTETEMFDFFVEDGTVKDLWETTIQSQMHHSGDEASDWEKPLRYALYIMLGSQGFIITKLRPAALIRTATDVLFRSSSPNGFFPGRMELSTNKPVDAPSIAEETLHSYYHASFEIPYILLTYAHHVSDAYKGRGPGSIELRRGSDPMPANMVTIPGSIPRLPQSHLDISLLQGDAEQRQELLSLSNFLLSRTTGSDLNTHRAIRDIRRIMKKAVPFDALFDSSNIVKLDDEWLYKYPDFLSRESSLKIAANDEGLKDMKRVLNPLGVSGWQRELDK